MSSAAVQSGSLPKAHPEPASKGDAHAPKRGYVQEKPPKEAEKTRETTKRKHFDEVPSTPKEGDPKRRDVQPKAPPSTYLPPLGHGQVLAQNQTVARMIAMAKAQIQRVVLPDQQAALSTFQTLIARGEGYVEAIAAAQRAMRSPDLSLRGTALALLMELVAKGQGYTEAAEVAHQEITGGAKELQGRAWILFGKLFEKGVGHAKALTIEKSEAKMIDILEKWIMRGAFQEAVPAFLQALIANDNSRDCLRDKAQSWLISFFPVQREGALQVFGALFQEGYGYAAAKQAAQAAMTSFETELSGIALFGQLFEEGKGYDEAIESAQKNMEASTQLTQLNAISLFQKLVAKGKGTREADAAARALIATEPVEWLRVAAEALLIPRKEELPERGTGRRSSPPSSSSSSSHQK